jgi:Transposase IS66 family
MDNSVAERALRTVALGRKNYLFAGSNTSGERAAAIYTLLGTAKLNSLDPELYLRTPPLEPRRRPANTSHLNLKCPQKGIRGHLNLSWFPLESGVDGLVPIKSWII